MGGCWKARLVVVAHPVHASEMELVTVGDSAGAPPAKCRRDNGVGIRLPFSTTAPVGQCGKFIHLRLSAASF